jgi:hypothetical protein
MGLRARDTDVSCDCTWCAGTTIWSPLASGLLSGKYAPGVVPEGSRFSHEKNAFLLKQLEGGEGVAGLEIKDPSTVFDKVML